MSSKLLLALCACFIMLIQNVNAQNYRPTSRDSFLDRLLQRDPDEYMRCMNKGPTEYHEKNVLCARATRMMLSCARPQEPEVYCGGYAFSYYGTGCMERRGYVNLLDHTNDQSVCQVPGAMWVFYGRCNSVNDNGRIPSVTTCHNRLKALLGEDEYNREIGAKVKRYMGAGHNMSREKALQAAVSGDRYGHMDLIGYRYNSFFNKINTKKIDFYTYIISQHPASHYATGVYHGKRILKACYLPSDDANRILGY